MRTADTGAPANNRNHTTACHRPKSKTSLWITVRTNVGAVRASTPTNRGRTCGHGSVNAHAKIAADARYMAPIMAAAPSGRSVQEKYRSVEPGARSNAIALPPAARTTSTQNVATTGPRRSTAEPQNPRCAARSADVTLHSLPDRCGA